MAEEENILYLKPDDVIALRGMSGFLDPLLEETDASGGVLLTFSPQLSINSRNVRQLLGRVKHPKKAINPLSASKKNYLFVTPRSRRVNTSNNSLFTFTQEEANSISTTSPYFAALARNPNGSLTLSIPNQLSGMNDLTVVNNENESTFQIPRNNVRKFLKTLRNNVRRGPKGRALAATFGHKNLNSITNKRLRRFYNIPMALNREAGREALSLVKAAEPRFRGEARSGKNGKVSKFVRASEALNPLGTKFFPFKLKQNRKTRRNRK